MRIIEYFDRIYILHLPERTDRYRLVMRELEQAAMPLQPGKVELFRAIRPDTANGFGNPGSRGCFLSHYAILRQARDEGLANVLILEDDLCISRRFGQDEEGITEQLRTASWGFVFLGHTLEGPADSPAKLRTFQKSVVQTHFYGIHSSIFDPLLAFMEALQNRPPGHPEGGPMSIDGAYNFFRARNPDVLTLVTTPNLAWQNHTRSDLSPRWFDDVFGLRQFAALGRIGKRWWKGT